MPIESFNGGTVVTGEGIPLMRLIVMRSALNAEDKGIKLVRHSVRAQVVRELGGKRKDANATLDAAIEVARQKVAEENRALAVQKEAK
jgi:hypothetical protein